MPDIKRTFSMEDLMPETVRSASDAHRKGKKRPVGTGEAVGQVRRDNRRLKNETEELIREYMQSQTDDVLLLDICDALKRRPSPIIRDIVTAMVDSGELQRSIDYGAGPTLPRYLYRMSR
jgi:hypothetical protein